LRETLLKTMQVLIKKLQTEIEEKDLKIQNLQNVITKYAQLTFEKDAEIQQLRGVIQNQELKIKKDNSENQTPVEVKTEDLAEYAIEESDSEEEHSSDTPEWDLNDTNDTSGNSSTQAAARRVNVTNRELGVESSSFQSDSCGTRRGRQESSYAPRKKQKVN